MAIRKIIENVIKEKIAPKKIKVFFIKFNFINLYK